MSTSHPAQIKPYWDDGEKAMPLADNMFPTENSGDFSSHQDLIRGSSAVNSTREPGRLSDPRTVGLRRAAGHDDAGRSPCQKQIYPKRAGTVHDVLDAARSARCQAGHVEVTTCPALVRRHPCRVVLGSVRRHQGRAQQSRVDDEHLLARDELLHRRIRAASFRRFRGFRPAIRTRIMPASPRTDTGPAWVSKIVDSVGKSKYWKSTGIIVVWEDWADGTITWPRRAGLCRAWHSRSDDRRLAVCEVRLRLSQQYEFGSIIRFVEDNWSLGRLGTTDTRANSMGDMFSFSQKAAQVHHDSFEVTKATASPRRSRCFFKE